MLNRTVPIFKLIKCENSFSYIRPLFFSVVKKVITSINLLFFYGFSSCGVKIFGYLSEC